MLWQARQGFIAGRAALDAAVAGGGDAAETTAFLARTSGLDATHTNAYKALINGLVSDSVFSKLDALYIFATDTTTNALLSLVSATYNASEVLAPTFNADLGYTGATNKYINANFNPTTAGSPKFTQDSASMFVWSNTTTLIVSSACGYVTGSTTGRLFIYPRSTSDQTWYGINDGSYMTAANADGKGFYAVDRSASNVNKGYKNGSNVATGSTASLGLVNANLSFVEGDNSYYTGQVMAGGFGQTLTATDHSNLYARIHTYLQTIAGIA